MTGPTHEHTNRVFAHVLMQRAIQMGFSLQDLSDMGGTRYDGITVGKEPDTAFKPNAFRPNKRDWPTLVIEIGVSKSLQQLRIDARWWLKNSGGNVNIVLIVHADRTSRTIVIEKWELSPMTASVTR